jgi:hypothetical protein
MPAGSQWWNWIILRVVNFTGGGLCGSDAMLRRTND